MKISFVGFGKFAKMLAAGLKTNPQYHLYAAAPSLQAGGKLGGIHTENDNKKILQAADCVILAVKPFQVRAVLEEIGTHLPPSCLLISVVTGVTTADLLKHCRKDQPIVRTMPNLPIAVQQGSTALFQGPHVHETQVQMVETLFSSLGHFSWVQNETDLDRLTALSGSGPAYVFLFLESLIAGATELGLSPELAKTFAIEMVMGSVVLAKESEMKLHELRASVTSPGGTTQAALEILEKGKFVELVKEAMQAAFLRAQALAKC